MKTQFYIASDLKNSLLRIYGLLFSTLVYLCIHQLTYNNSWPSDAKCIKYFYEEIRPKNKVIALLVEVVSKFMGVCSNLYAYPNSSKSNIKNTFKQIISFENKNFVFVYMDEKFALFKHETILEITCSTY